MSIVQHIKVLDSQLANIKIVAGSTIYTRDTGKHFIDISDTERVQISDIIYIDTDKERTALLAPLPDKLYITRDTNKVWVYSVKSDKWVCLNIDTTYTAGTGISIDGTTINNSGVRSVTAGASANKINVNTNGNTNTITINNVANATSAGKATNDSAGQQINTTYIKELSVSGKVITYTKGDGTTGTITTQDTDTWRGIQNVLTSDSTTDSLSAAQGKALKGLVDGKAAQATTLAGYNITDAYTKSEVNNKVNVRSSNTLPDDAPDGTIIINPDEDTEIFNVDNINIDIDSALSLTSTNPVQNKVVTKELERIPCKLTIKCTSFDGEILTEENTYGFYYNIFDGNKIEDGGYVAVTPYPTVKTVYKNCTYKLLLYLSREDTTQLGQYYDPIIKGVELSDPVTSPVYGDNSIEKVFTVTQDTEITIMFQKKREPITLTINLKDKNGNFVSDDVIVTDSFDNNSRTFGTYGKTPGQFTVQVTKGYEYTITPSLKGYNKKEDNSPTDPDKTSITQTSIEDTVIDIVYNKIYPNDFATDWASFHAQIAANPGTEVLPIGTELSTIITDDVGSATQVKFHIVNWRYADKEDGSQVWGCDLLTTQMKYIPFRFYESGNEGYSWKDSQIRSMFNDSRFIGYFESNFANHIQKVKVTSGDYKNTPVYTYDNMWLPSATEMYIDTAINTGPINIFTKVVEGNNNEKYWKNIMGASSKFDSEIANRELIFLTRDFNDISNMYESSPTEYWLRSCAFTVNSPNPDSTNENYIYNYNIFIVDTYGMVSRHTGTDSIGNAIRPMCFFA